jgi:Flp pilus assembly protein TadD
MKIVVNRRFLLIFGICLLVGGAAVHGLHAFQVNRQSSFLLEEARRAKSEHQFERAINRYQQYSKLVPRDFDGQAEYGLLLADLGSIRAAALTLENVLREQPDRADVRLRIVQLEKGLGRYHDALYHVGKAIEASPNDASLLHLRGECQYLDGQLAEAAKSFQEAYAHEPHQIKSFVARAAVQRERALNPQSDNAQSLQKDADETMTELISNNSTSAEAHARYGEYLESLAREEFESEDRSAAQRGPQTVDKKAKQAQLEKSALAEAEASLEIEPRYFDALLLAARLESSLDSGKASEFAKQAKKSEPKKAGGYLALAGIEERYGKLDEAIACLEEGVKATAANDLSVLLELGRLQVFAGEQALSETSKTAESNAGQAKNARRAKSELTNAHETIDRLHKLPISKQQEALVGDLAARLAFAEQRWREAISLFEQVAPQLADRPVLLRDARFRIAQSQERLGNTELALASYREAVRLTPTWPPARLGVAASLVALGKFDDALEEYRLISKIDGMEAAGMANVVRLLIIKHPVEETDWSEVDDILSRLRPKSPDDIGWTLLQAAAWSKQPDKAAELDSLLHDAREKTPQNVDIWTFSIGLSLRQQNWKSAAELIDKAELRFGDQSWLRFVKASYAVARYGQESSPKLKALGDKLEEFTDDDRVKLHLGLANLLLRIGDADQAAEFARRASLLEPSDLNVRKLMYECARVRNDATAARNALEEIKRLDGESAFWHLGQAALCLLPASRSQAVDDAAFQHLIEAGKLRRGWGEVPFVRAQIQDRRGQTDPALQSYLEAINLGEHNPVAVRRAVELLNSRQRYAESARLLRILEQQATLASIEIERLDSEVSAKSNDLDRAVLLARKFAKNSKEWRDKAWLGQLLRMKAHSAGSGQKETYFTEAEQSLRDAVSLKPEAPEPWVLLVEYLAETGRTEEANTEISRLAEQQLPRETSAWALAVCYEHVHKMEEAAHQYHMALASGAQDPLAVRLAVEFFVRAGKLSDAEPRLRIILSAGSAAKPDEVSWARRTLAAVLRRSGSYAKLQEALGVIEQNLAAGTTAEGTAREDQLEKARLLALIPQSSRRREAIAILKDLLPSQADPSEIHLLLSRLYAAEKNPLQSLNHLRELATSPQKEKTNLALYIAAYASRLLERQETAEAESWILRLDQLAPNEFSTASVKAEWHVQRNQVEDAIDTLRAYCNQPVDQPADRTVRLAQVAAACEQISRGPSAAIHPDAIPKLLAAAEAALSKLVEQQPDRLITLAAFLGRRGRFEKALELLKQVAPTAKPELMAGACGDLLNAGVAKELHPRLEQLLLDAAARHDRPVTVLLALGDLRIAQDRLNEAVELYREVLKKDPNNAPAMNNLGVLLAQKRERLDEALSLIDRALSLAGPVPALLDSRASVYLAMGKPELARVDLEQAVSEEPRPNRQFHLALAYWRLGQQPAANKVLEEALMNGKLKAEKLPPLERADYDRLMAELKK